MLSKIDNLLRLRLNLGYLILTFSLYATRSIFSRPTAERFSPTEVQLVVISVLSVPSRSTKSFTTVLLASMTHAELVLSKEQIFWERSLTFYSTSILSLDSSQIEIQIGPAISKIACLASRKETRQGSPNLGDVKNAISTFALNAA